MQRQWLNSGGERIKRKYHNKKIAVNGITFDSRKEAERWLELSILKKAGEISGLQRQVKFLLIRSQREEPSEKYLKGRKKGQFKPGKLLEKEVSYYADFAYFDKEGKLIVEDVKGVRTEVYKIKRKLMLERYGIRIREI